MKTTRFEKGLLILAALLLCAAVVLSTQAIAQGTTVTATAGQTATLNWTAPTANTDGSAIAGTLTYNVYNCPAGSTTGAASQCTQLANGLTAATWTSAALTAGTLNYAVTAVETSGGGPQESALSNIVTLTVASAPPNPPGSLTITVH